MAKANSKASSPKKSPAKKASQHKARGARGARGYKTAKGTANRKPEELVSKRGETIDFADLTHTITGGIYEKFQGIKISDDEASEDGTAMTVVLLKNSRGKKMKQSVTLRVEESEVRELTSDDMVESIDLVEDEGEDKELIAYEQGSWECSKCKTMNRNDAGFCSNVVDRKQCGGTQKCKEMKSWAGCFKTKETWKCEGCTMANDMGSNECVACGATAE